MGRLLKIVWILTIIILFGLNLNAQTVNISGQYLDQKYNPIDSAVVLLIENSIPIDADTTSSNGSFSLSYTYTQIEELFQKPTLKCYPNPFSNIINIDLNAPDKGIISLFNTLGTSLFNYEISQAGNYEFVWGAVDMSGNNCSSGIYYLVYRSDKSLVSEKIILLPDGYATTPLEIHSEAPVINHLKVKKVKSQSLLQFTKPNTTDLDFTFNIPLNDTIVGDIIGNSGSVILDFLYDTLYHDDSTKLWNLNSLVYNDEQSFYEIPIVPNMTIIEDSILQYNPNIPVFLQLTISVIDMSDNNLISELPVSLLIKHNEIQPELQIPDFTINEDTSLNILIDNINQYRLDTDIDTLQYTLLSQSNPELINLILNDTSIVIDSLKHNGYGLSEIWLKYQDTTYVDSVSFMVNVLSVPDDFTYNIPDIIIQEDTPDSILLSNLNVYVNDPDDDIISYSIISQSNSGLINAEVIDTALYVNYLQADGNGISSVELEITDGVFTHVDTINIEVQPQPDPPLFNIPGQIINEDDTTSLLIDSLEQYVIDPDGDSFSFTIISQSNTSLASLGVIGNDIFMNNLEPNGNGISEIAVEVFDGVYADTAFFSLTVLPVNDPPELSIPDFTINEDDSTFILISQLLFYSQDIDGDSLDFQMISQSNLSIVVLTIQDSSLIISNLEPDSSGVSELTLMVSDGQYSDTTTFILTILPQPDPPVINIPDQYLNEDDTISVLINDLGLYVTDPDNDTLNYSILSQSNPSLININLTGTNLWVDSLISNGNGVSELVIVVDDGIFTDTAWFTVNVLPVNDPPTIDLPDFSLIEDDTTSVLIQQLSTYANDIDGDGLSFQLISQSNTSLIELEVLNESLNILSLTPDSSGYSDITIVVSDGQETDTATFTITVLSQPDVPVFIIPDQTILEDDTTVVLLSYLDEFVIDPDNNEFTFNLLSQSNPSLLFLSIDSTFVNIDSLQLNGNGSSEIAIEVFDGVFSDTAIIGVNVTPVNDAPVTDIPDFTILEDDTVSVIDAQLSIYVDDPDGDSLTFSLLDQSNLTLVEVGVQGEELQLLALQEDSSGLSEVTIIVSDGQINDTSSFIIEVIAQADPPQFEIPNQTIFEDDTVNVLLSNLDIYVTDPDQDNFTYTIVSQSNTTLIGLQVIGDSVNIANLQPDGFGYSDIAIEVNDGVYSDTAFFTVSVIGTNDAPELVIPDINISEDDTTTQLIPQLSNYAFDADGDSMSYQLLSQSNANLIQLNLQNEALQIVSLQPDSSGNSEITILVSDGILNDTTLFTVNVLPMPDIRGTITDIFDSTTIAGAVIEIRIDSNTVCIDTTDANGGFHIQLPQPAAIAYFSTTITDTLFTPFHTWTTVVDDYDFIQDFTMIPLTFDWGLFDQSFRANCEGWLPGYGSSTIHWVAPPEIQIFNVSTYVGSYPWIENNTNASAYYIENVLPTFNPRDVSPSNIIIKNTDVGENFEDGELWTYWNSPGASAGYALWYPVGFYPIISKSDVQFGAYVNPVFPNPISFVGGNAVYNQEFGSAFGATQEPASTLSNIWDSVFFDTPAVDSFTVKDLQGAKVYLNRSRVHYVKGSFCSPALSIDHEDWEMRPDSVQNYYPGKNVQ